MIENACVTEKQIQQSRTLGQLERVPALVREEGADVDGEVLLVGKRGGQGQREPVVVRPLVGVHTEAVLGAVVLGDVVLAVVVRRGDGALDLGTPEPTHPGVLFVHELVVIVLVFAEKVDFLIRIEVSQVHLLQGQCPVGGRLVDAEAGQELLPSIAPVDLGIVNKCKSQPTSSFETGLTLPNMQQCNRKTKQSLLNTYPHCAHANLQSALT